jgi:RNA polymerase sigma-70 factor (ECF subfamily)
MHRSIHDTQSVPLSPAASPSVDVSAAVATPARSPLDWHLAVVLIARVAAGDEAALAALYDAYAPVLYTVALRVVRAEADAEEVVLETFTQLWRDAARFDPARGSAFAWLMTICRTRALDRVRARTRGARALERATSAHGDEAPALAAWRPDPAAEYERHDRYGRLAAAVRSLPPAVRQVVELVLTESLTHTELAERLGLPLGTVKTRMRTGLRLLRDALGRTLLD